jgi:hypothetical protein
VQGAAEGVLVAKSRVWKNVSPRDWGSSESFDAKAIAARFSKLWLKFVCKLDIAVSLTCRTRYPARAIRRACTIGTGVCSWHF